MYSSCKSLPIMHCKFKCKCAPGFTHTDRHTHTHIHIDQSKRELLNGYVFSPFLDDSDLGRLVSTLTVLAGGGKGGRRGRRGRREKGREGGKERGGG